MLALAAWDRHARTLWLARDRVGKKPLYYGWTGDGTFLFGSELAALRNDGEVFLVRHFPVNASDAVRVRSVATAPGATRLFATSSGVGLDGLRASDADGAPTPLLPSATGPGAGSESDPGSPTTVKAAPTTGGGP